MFNVDNQKLGHINLRGNAADGRYFDGVSAALGQELPIVANTMSQSVHRIYWLGPDEWQIVTALHHCKGLLDKLDRELRGQHAAVNDVSAGQVTFHLSGPDASVKLGKGCTLDLHPSAFRLGDCAQSSLAKTGMLLGKIDEAPVYELIVRRSFSEYLLRWLHQT